MRPPAVAALDVPAVPAGPGTVALRLGVAVASLAAVLLLSACGGGTSEAGAVPDASGPEECVTSGGGDQPEVVGSLTGLSEAEATARVTAAGYTVRLAGRGDECFALTMDYRPDRVNLDLTADGTVRGASVG